MSLLVTAPPVSLHRHNGGKANVKSEIVSFPLQSEVIAYQVGWLKCITPVWREEHFSSPPMEE